ncbi:DUF125-domain-containing protein [Dacryopinax primogenitus]|uniref:DUF125-domain-containing protein n=1 Tax=Dacryopinax primogenitus (strain DJM 731) TaxID=1858805 RepID=M5FP67_DACPD|nr:DUF125-domain-containing protein [Dacryopinax primogenitus]EJT96848.1 DUF125-domain-containing protein [Dacryopinax primogenitus]
MDSPASAPTTTPQVPSTPVSVPLPRRAPRNSMQNVWTTRPYGPDDIPETPLSQKCGRVDGVCCKDLKGEDERTLVDPDVVRDIVIGLSDGLTVPFALTAGLSGLGDSRIVVLGGFAELIAGAISMGIGGFLASQSERDHFRYLRKQTHDRVARSCDGEMMREVYGVLGPVGVDEQTSRQVAMQLRKVEWDMAAATAAESPATSWRSRLPIGKGKHVANGNGHLNGNGTGIPHPEDGGLKWSDDVGLTAFLLKFGEGMEEVPTRRLYLSALTIGLGYFLGGLIPLLPYFFFESANMALIYSCLLTGIILLIFGAVKTHFTGATGGIGGYIKGAISMLVVGGAAAGAAFGCVKILEVHS